MQPAFLDIVPQTIYAIRYNFQWVTGRSRIRYLYSLYYPQIDVTELKWVFDNSIKGVQPQVKLQNILPKLGPCTAVVTYKRH